MHEIGAVVKDIHISVNVLRTLQAMDTGKLDLSPKLLARNAKNVLKFVSSAVMTTGLVAGVRRLGKVGRGKSAIGSQLAAVQGCLKSAKMAYKVLAAYEARATLSLTASKWEKMKIGLQGFQSVAAIGFTVLGVVGGPQVKASLALISVAMSAIQLYLDSYT